MVSSIKIFLLVEILCLAYTAHGELDFTREPSPGFTIGWKFEGDDVIFEVTGPTQGWIGIGFSKSKTMVNADLILMGVKDGKPYVWDAFSLSTGYVQMDASQDVSILDSFENATHTYVKIRRPLTTGDEKDNDILKGENDVIWAYGSKDKLEEINTEDYHWGKRGYLRLNTLLKESEVATQPTTTHTTHTTTPISQVEVDKVYIDDGNTDLPYSISLNRENTVHLRWNFDGSNVTLQLIAPTTGWIGIGFSHSSSMFGADLIMMGVSGENTYALDCHSAKNGVPDVDEQQDVKITGSWENGTHTMVTITRNRVACDDDDMSIKEGTYKVIWAYGETDFDGINPIEYDYHMRNRGALSLKLINSRPVADKKDIVEEEFNQLDIRLDNFKIPALDTYYLCRIFAMPEQEKQHVIGYDIILTPGNEKNVHHLVVYLCDDLKDTSLAYKDMACFQEVNTFLIGCTKMFAAWAVGMSNVRFPMNTGYPIGGSKGPKHLLLETHYDNPDLKADLIDSSGVRFYYTENIREYDIGILTVSFGLQSIWIPPNTGKYRVNGLCPNQCLSKGFKDGAPDEVSVIGTFLHGHLAARGMRLKHYRNGKEIESVAKDDYYDFDYQELQFNENKDKKIHKEDTLIMECEYGTLGKTNITTGGLGTRNEMCTAFVFHYPAIDLVYCDTRSAALENPGSFNELMKGLNITVTDEELSYIQTEVARRPLDSMEIFATTVLNKVNWTEENIRFAESFIDKSTRRPTCGGGSDGGLVLGYMDDIAFPEMEPYVEKNECNIEESSHEESSTQIVLVPVLASTVIILLLVAAKASM